MRPPYERGMFVFFAAYRFVTTFKNSSQSKLTIEVPDLFDGPLVLTSKEHKISYELQKPPIEKTIPLFVLDGEGKRIAVMSINVWMPKDDISN